MLVIRVIQLAIFVSILMPVADAAAKSAVKLCGRTLSDIMSRVCYAYNSPSPAYISPTVKGHPGSVRRRRHIGIADQCCTIGCTWEQLNEYCAISINSDSPMIASDSHTIADRSAEGRASTAGSAAALSLSESPAVPPVIGGRTASVGNKGDSEGSEAQDSASARREVGRGRRGGYGRARAKGRRCWCRRKRRSDRRRRTFLMGNTGLIRNADRAAPMVGTVSPLLTWGRTLNTDFPPINRERYTYVVYT